MIDNIDYNNAGTSLAAPKYDRLNAPMPSREELLKRNSFGSPDDNKYLTTLTQRRINAAEAELREARQAEFRRKWGVK